MAVAAPEPHTAPLSSGAGPVMNETTIHWRRLQTLLDTMFGFANRTRSTIKKASQTFDDRTQDHVIDGFDTRAIGDKRKGKRGK